MDPHHALTGQLNSFLQMVGYSTSGKSFRTGWADKSIGVPTQHGTWLRLTSWPVRNANSRLQGGYVDAEMISGLRKPRVLNEWRWDANGKVWQALELSLAEGVALSPGSDAMEPFTNLPNSWWETIGASLRTLAILPTLRQAVTQDYLSRRLLESVGLPVEATRVANWETSHRDLHWGNLTDRAEILDWEGWGRAPAGFDVATLWSASLDHPVLARYVLERLPHQADDTFMLSQLLACEELVRRYEHLGSSSSLVGPARAEMKSLASSYRRSETRDQAA